MLRRLWIVPLLALLFSGVGLAQVANARRGRLVTFGTTAARPQAHGIAAMSRRVATTLQGPAGASLNSLLKRIAAENLPTPRGTIFVSPSAAGGGTASLQPDGQYRISVDGTGGTAPHELGHAIDQFDMTDQQRQRFRGIMHDPREWGAPGARDNGEANAPREQFAEAYRMLVQHPTMAANERSYQHFMDNGYRGYNFNPSYFQLRKIAKLLRSLS